MKFFVACSSKEGVTREYLNLSSSIATLLVRNNHKLVFAGKDTGMMGKVFITYKYEEGKIKAVLDIHDSESFDFAEVNAYEVAPSTFERTKILYQSSDAVLILPGDIEVFAEFMSVLEENKTKCVNKPVILFNYNNFYTPLLKIFENSFKEGFLEKDDTKSFVIIEDLENLDKYLHKIS